MRSLAVKLTLAFLGVSLIGIVLVAFFAARVSGEQVATVLSQQQQKEVITIIKDLYRQGESWESIASQIPEEYEPRDFLVIDEEDRVLLAGLGLRPGQRVPPEFRQDKSELIVNNDSIGFFIVPNVNGRRGPGGPPPPQPPSNQTIMNNINRGILIGALGALFISSVVGFVLARRITKPLKEITAASQAIAKGDLSQKINFRSADELGTLANSFNKMSEDLAESQRQRRQMTADIAHDLRTPLSLIVGHAEAIEDGILPASAETIHVIHDEAKRLNHLIEDLRTLSLADTGELTIVKQSVNPKDLLNRAGMAHSPAAREKNIQLTINADTSIPTVDLDPNRISQVLDNLISNAIRYTPENGHVSLGLAQEKDMVKFSIQDSGPGIKNEDLKHIFERFYRADKARTRSEGGSGLGLAIAKSLIQQHQGEIWVTSQIGEGSTFHFSLPSSTII